MRRLRLDLDSCGGSDPSDIGFLILRRGQLQMFWSLARCGVLFQRLHRLGRFPACWRLAIATTIPKGPLSSVANYKPTSMTPRLSEVFERLVSVHLGLFQKCRDVFHTTLFARRKCLITCDALISVSKKNSKCIGERAGGYDRSNLNQCSFWCGQPSGNSLQSLLCGRRGSVLSVLAQCLFLSNGCLSKLVYVLSGVPHCQCFWLWTVPRVHHARELFSILKNKLTGYADDSTLFNCCCAIYW